MSYFHNFLSPISCFLNKAWKSLISLTDPAIEGNPHLKNSIQDDQTRTFQLRFPRRFLRI